MRKETFRLQKSVQLLLGYFRKYILLTKLTNPKKEYPQNKAHPCAEIQLSPKIGQPLPGSPAHEGEEQQAGLQQGLAVCKPHARRRAAFGRCSQMLKYGCVFVCFVGAHFGVGEGSQKETAGAHFVWLKDSTIIIGG